MTSSARHAGPTRVTWRLPVGAVPAWVEQTVALLQRSGELDCRFDQRGRATAAQHLPPRDGDERTVDVVLWLDAADLGAGSQAKPGGLSSPHTDGFVGGSADGSAGGFADGFADASAGGPSDAEAWLLTDGHGQPLSVRQPLLHSVTAGQGVSLALWRYTAGGLPQRVSGLPGPAAAHGAAARWVCLRRLHVLASPRYGHGQRQLVPALAQLLRQTCLDRKLGVQPTLADASTTGLRRRATPGAPAEVARPVLPPLLPPLLPLLRGAWRAWVQQQHARWMRERWLIGIVDLPLPMLLRGGARPPVHWLTPPPGLGYWADPMGHGQRDQEIVCEYFDERIGQGHIERLTVGAQGRVLARTPVPLGEGHLSFPLVVRLNGRQLGMAESSARRECVLHEVDADGHWRPIATLLPGVAAADPALFAWGGRYWLAYTDIDRGETDNLCLQYANALEGPWQPHANNPVKWDVTSARMAGGFFVHEGALYRPAQNCLTTYGASVVVHRVLHCSPTLYEEEPVLNLLPDPHSPCPDGLHTLSAWGGRTLVDGKQHVFSPTTLWLKLWRRLRRRNAPKTAKTAQGASASGSEHAA